jgi:hypothetical protein
MVYANLLVKKSTCLPSRRYLLKAQRKASNAGGIAVHPIKVIAY